MIKGGELFELILRKGTFPEKDCALIISQILSAVEFLHGLGIMHRDIKPENIILKDKSTNYHVFLADFGLASYFDRDLLFKRCGTPGYVAPEILDDKPYKEKVDIFSCGVILYILLSGCSPFFGKSYNEILKKNKKCRVDFNLKNFGPNVCEEGNIFDIFLNFYRLQSFYILLRQFFIILTTKFYFKVPRNMI